ncbi:MAG: hypothetical protein ACRCSU_01895, partial [Paracoccaceae bacterium]
MGPGLVAVATSVDNVAVWVADRPYENKHHTRALSRRAVIMANFSLKTVGIGTTGSKKACHRSRS